MKIIETDDYDESYGDCLFFHFNTFEEPPEVYCGSPLDAGFDENYWNYFTRDINLNDVIEQAEKLHNDGLQEFMAN